MNRLKRKLNSRKGMTLTEVLVAVAILGLVSLGAAVGVNSSLRVYRQSVALSDAQTLSSTLSIAVMDELRYAQNIRPDGSFTSKTYGSDVALKIDDDGHLTLGGSLLVSEAAYAGLKLDGDTFSCAYDGGSFAVEFTVTDGVSDIQTVVFSVTPLNSQTHKKGALQNSALKNNQSWHPEKGCQLWLFALRLMCE